MERKNKWSHLRQEERQVIYMMRTQGHSLREIGRILGRSVGTISKELKRNRDPNARVWLNMSCYERSASAHTRAKERARSSRKRGRYQGILQEAAFREWIVEKLSEDKWSPEIIANNAWRFRCGVRISTSTLYRFIKQYWKELIALLPRRGRNYRRRITNARSAFRGGRGITERPAIENIFGHHEIDTVVSSKHSTSILSSRERVSRYAILQRIPNLRAETVKHRLHGQLMNLAPEARRSWTHDNGPEFASLFELEAQTGIETYRCDPYSSWQRGSVENLNGLLRRFYPKGTDFRDVTDEQLREVERKINDRPLKCLGWLTPAEVFHSLS